MDSSNILEWIHSDPMNTLRLIQGVYPLHYAILNRMPINVIQTIVKMNPVTLDLNDKDGHIALHIAILIFVDSADLQKYTDEEREYLKTLVRTLVDGNNSSIYTCTPQYSCALALASCSNVHASIFSMLVDMDNTLNTLTLRSYDFETQSPNASFMQSHLVMKYCAPLETLEYISLKAPGTLADPDTLFGRTPLHWGVYNKQKKLHVDCVMFLIRKYPHATSKYDRFQKLPIDYEIDNHQKYNTLVSNEMDIECENLFFGDVDMDMDVDGWNGVAYRDTTVLVQLMRFFIDIDYSMNVSCGSWWSETRAVIKSCLNSQLSSLYKKEKHTSALLVLDEIEVHESSKKALSSDKLLQLFNVYRNI